MLYPFYVSMLNCSSLRRKGQTKRGPTRKRFLPPMHCPSATLTSGEGCGGQACKSTSDAKGVTRGYKLQKSRWKKAVSLNRLFSLVLVTSLL